MRKLVVRKIAKIAILCVKPEVAEISDSSGTYHFPVHDINDLPSNAVIIRNLPSGFYLSSQAGHDLKSMIENLCPIVSTNEECGVVTVALTNTENAVNVAAELDGQLFHDEHLRVSHKDNEQLHHTLLHTSRTPPAGDVQPYDFNAENERETDVKLEHPLKQPIRSYCDTGGECV